MVAVRHRDPVPDEGISLVRSRTGNPGSVTRHRPRTDLSRLTIRLLAVLLLLLGVGGSAYLSENRDRRSERAAAAEAVSHRAELDALRRLAEAERRTDRGERSPLSEAMEAAMEQAREQAAEAARQRGSRADPAQASPAPPEPEPATGGGAPSEPVGPVPASCGEYGGNRATGCALLLEAGYSLDQMSCLDNVWTKESGWNERAQNPSSGAYGIPQALPGSKMATVGDDWQTNPATQIRWGLTYIDNRYGTPCAAWQFSQANGWY